MNQFPKKYKAQDLYNWAKNYKENKSNTENEDYMFSVNSLPISYKISYEDFFTIYMNSFFIHKKNIENNETTNNPLLDQLFIVE